MLNPDVLKILKEKVFFMGTSCDNIPRVRPMRPFIDSCNHIWLVSHADGGKNEEIQLNNHVELCTLGTHYEVLRLQGTLISEQESTSPDKKAIRKQIKQILPSNLFADSNDSSMILYDFLVDNIIFRNDKNSKLTELNFKAGQ
jgi:uncharacterized pyridoxamine 5'-phosphate oxidase family protein